MKTAKVVIGSSFGDEGKGHITDYFASEYGKDCLVVRFNGGAQAGHTVVTPEGKRHVFHHFGSGSFVGARTFLSKFFVVNPILFDKEWQELQTLGINPKVYADPDCLVTTLYDMIINQIIEDYRGDKKHGSCGVGFNETIERSTDPKYRLQVKDLYNQNKFLSILRKIVGQYLPHRLTKLGIDKIPDFYLDILTSTVAVENYFNDCMFFISQIERINDIILLMEDNIIFEGSQGLLLDQDHHYFPHVTRSKTGIHNVLELISESDIDNLDITYVTRPYATRHGAGIFPNEYSVLPKNIHIENETNVYNKYQEGFRVGQLDVGVLRETVHKDLLKVDNITYRHSIAITCMDQMSDGVSFSIDGLSLCRDKEEFLDYLTNEIMPHSIYTCNGPTRNDIERSYPYENNMEI